MGKKITNCIVIAGFLLIVLSFYSLYSLEFSYGTTQIGEEDNTTLAAGYEAESVSDLEAAPASLTVQPSASDTFIRNGASSGTNFGAKTDIRIKNAIVGYERTSILSFDFSSLDGSAAIESAYLDLYYWSNSIGNDPVGQAVVVNRLTQTGWVEDEATWDDYKNTTPWTTAGGDYVATDQAAATMPGGFGFVRWTVTEQVRHAQKNTSEIANMLVKFSSSAAPNAAARFLSKESGDPSRYPRLIINYTMNGAAPAPAPVAQTGSDAIMDRDDGELKRGVAWPIPRFTDNGDGTVRDNLTGIIWDKNANRFGTQGWWPYLDRDTCGELADNGDDLTDGSSKGDWHLANVKEYLSLIHYGVSAPAVPDTLGTGQWSQGDPFINLQSADEGPSYLSSTVDVPSGPDVFDATPAAILVHFAAGSVHSFIVDNVLGFHWCVRDDQPLNNK